MKLQLVPASRGALWVRQGFQVFFRRPIALASLFSLFMLALLVIGLVPVAGAVVGFGAMPLMSLGFMVATQKILGGQSPGPAVFWLPLRGEPARKRHLLKLGLVYALCLVAMLSIWILVDGERLEAYRVALSSLNADSSPEALNAMAPDGRLLLSLLTPLFLIGLLSVPFWHAPALVHWGGLPMGKALFFSTMACWRNRAAFFVYGLVLLALAMFATLFSVLLGGQQYAAVLALPVGLLTSTVFYASLFFTFVDCFEMPPAEKETAP